MTRLLMTLALVGVSAAAQATEAGNSRAHSVNAVVAWNRTLLSIVRTPGAQPPTIHSTRSFAILHAAIYDAVNAIDRTHAPYMVSVPATPHRASREAAANAAAHDVLGALYPALKSTLDAEWQQTQDDSGAGDQAEGNRIGQVVAEQILALRSHDGSSVQPGAYVFGTGPGDYQSTPPNFPPQPQFTHWAFVTPFTMPACQSVSSRASAIAGKRAIC